MSTMTDSTSAPVQSITPTKEARGRKGGEKSRAQHARAKAEAVLAGGTFEAVHAAALAAIKTAKRADRAHDEAHERRGQLSPSVAELIRAEAGVSERLPRPAVLRVPRRGEQYAVRAVFTYPDGSERVTDLSDLALETLTSPEDIRAYYADEPERLAEALAADRKWRADLNKARKAIRTNLPAEVLAAEDHVSRARDEHLRAMREARAAMEACLLFPTRDPAHVQAKVDLIAKHPLFREDPGVRHLRKPGGAPLDCWDAEDVLGVLAGALARDLCAVPAPPPSGPAPVPEGGSDLTRLCAHALVTVESTISQAKGDWAAISTEQAEQIADLCHEIMDRSAATIPELYAKAYALDRIAPSYDGLHHMPERVASGLLADVVRLLQPVGDPVGQHLIKRAWDIAQDELARAENELERDGSDEAANHLLDRRASLAYLPSPDLFALQDKLGRELFDVGRPDEPMDEMLARMLRETDWTQRWPVLVYLDLVDLCHRQPDCPQTMREISYPLAAAERLRLCGLTPWMGGFTIDRSGPVKADPFAMIAGVAHRVDLVRGVAA